MIHHRIAAGALALGLFTAGATGAHAQNFPMTSGDYVEISEITIEDGHNLDYANFLASQWKAQEEFAKSQGWITGYEVLANVNKRAGEADLYLLVRMKSLPDAAESAKREDVARAHVKMTDAQMEASSGDRAKYRHVIGSQLLQVLNFK